MRRSCSLVPITLAAAGIAVVTSALADPPSPGPARPLLTDLNRGRLASPRLVSPVRAGDRSARLPEARIALAPMAPAQVVGGPLFPPGCVFFEDYSSYRIGQGLGSVVFVADDAFYMSLGGVPPVGSAPNGAPVDRYLLFARRTLNDGINPNFELGYNVRSPELLTPTVDQPAQLSQLVYMPTDDGQPRTSTWWSPLSFVQGTIADRVFFGGTDIGGVLEFGQNAQGVLDRFMSLGILPDQSGAFFAPPLHPNFPFPVDQWFTIMLNMSQNAGGGLGQSVWIKSNDTVASIPPFLDPRMASGDIVAPDGDPLGWVNTNPGHADDPATPNVIEGIGLAVTQFNQPAQTNGAFEQAPTLAVVSLNGVQLGIGLDPPHSIDPNFVPNDYLFGPACFSGQVFVKPCPIPDFTLTYTDDFEDWTRGAAIQLQGDRWADGVESEPTVISLLQNTTPGGSQSIAHQNINSDNIFRLTFKTTLPPRAVAQTGAPLVVSSQVRLSSSASTPRTSYAVALRDSQWQDDVAGWVFLGGLDPTNDSPYPQSDGMVYVRQPNPAFDPTMPAQDDMVQANWIDPTLWVTPPNPPLNLRYLLVPTGATVPAIVFQEVRFEIEPSAAAMDFPPTLRVFYGGVELFPTGDSSQSFVAGSRTADALEFWSGNDVIGQFEVIHVDDVQFDGPRRQVGAGPLFLTPYADGFESYTPNEPIDGQGDTPFLDAVSLPVGPISQNAPQLAIVPGASAPAAGDLVCRYQLTKVCLDDLGLLPPVDSVIAVSLAPVAPPTPGAGEQLCPGFSTSSLLTPPTVEVRTPDANVRVAVAGWQLLNDQSVPTPFDPLLGDETGFDYHFTFKPRWRVVTPMSQAQIVTDPTDATNQVLRLVNPGAIDGSLNNFPLFDMVSAILPETQASVEDFPAPSFASEVRFDLYIESVDGNGQPVAAAPRTRLSLPINSAEPNSGLITEIIFGGPSVFNAPAQDISYRSASSNGDLFVDTNVSLLTGAMGIAGPLVNTWLRVIVSVNEVGAWTLSIDEDRDGPLAPVVIAQGDPIDAPNPPGDPAGNPTIDLSRIAAFQLRQGRDAGGDGEAPNSPPASRWFVENLALEAAQGPPACADLAGDSTMVDGADLATLLARWGPKDPANTLGFDATDYNNDGVINGFDLATLLSNWGPCP